MLGNYPLGTTTLGNTGPPDSAIVWADKFTPQSTAYLDKYSAQETEYQDKYHPL